jgi:hypothetical protein
MRGGERRADKERGGRVGRMRDKRKEVREVEI